MRRISVLQVSTRRANARVVVDARLHDAGCSSLVRAPTMARRVDLVIAHGLAAARAATAMNTPKAPVVLRPHALRTPMQLRPGLRRRIAAVAVRDERGADYLRDQGFAPSLVWILSDDDADGWVSLVYRLLGESPLAKVRQQASRLQLRPAATRVVGDDLLVAGPDPERAVVRLTGAGPELWSLFSCGTGVEAAADTLEQRMSASHAEIMSGTVAFARRLVDLGLAEPA